MQKKQYQEIVLELYIKLLVDNLRENAIIRKALIGAEKSCPETQLNALVPLMPVLRTLALLRSR